MNGATVTTKGDIVAYTNERNFFKTVSNDCLLRNYQKYLLYLDNHERSEQFPNLRIGLELCMAEMKDRGIDIPQTL